MLRLLVPAISTMFLVACAAATPVHTTARPPSPARFVPLGAEASAIDFARIAKFPEPGWQVPRATRWSHDGSTLAYLASETQNDEMSLFAFDRASKTSSVLVRAKDLPGGTRPRSREEELRRERTRNRAEGISQYRLAKRANVIVIPHGGDVFVRDAKGVVTRLTDTPEPEVDPKPCPTGERVAFVRKNELVSVDVSTKRETTLTHGAVEGVTHGLSDFVAQEELGESSGFFWSSKCDRIAYFDVDERKVSTTPVLGYRKGQPDLMQQRYPEAGGTNPLVKLAIVDVATRKSVSVRFDDEEERYLVDLEWSEDGKYLYLQSLARTHKKVSLVRVDPSTGATTELFGESNPAWVWPADTRLTKTTNEVVMTTEASGWRHIVVRKLEPNAPARVLTSGQWEVESIVAVSDDRVLFTAGKDDVLQRHLYSVPLAGGPITTITTERGVHRIAADEGGTAWVDLSSAHDRLPKAHVVIDGAVAGELAIPPDPDLEKLALRPVELVELKGPSGDVLHGALLRPRHLQPGVKHPAVVMVYGGPTVQTVMDAWGARLLWQHLADRGFFVFQLDNRGTPGRGVAFERSVHKHLGDLELQDQVAGAAYLASIPEVDPTRIGISGHSYGGFLSALAMLRAPDRFAAGVVGAPVTDWRLYDTGYTERFMETPATNAGGYAAAEVTKDAANLRGRLFLIHGEMDENVHYANSARLIDALVAARKPFDLMLFPGERHGNRSPAALAYVNQRIATFFVERLSSQP